MATSKTRTPKKATKQKERNLTVELARFLDKTLLPDLESRAKEPSVHHALEDQFEAERAQRRTADTFEEWTTRTLEQVGVAWILSCVFIRTLEDRDYLTHVRLAGEGAADSEHLFLDLFPSLTIRDYLLALFRELSHLPGGEEVLGPRHNPAWRLSPSVDAIRGLVAFFREVDADSKLVWSFGGTRTRFLGDLYQDISASVRERYALLQTPEFVEEFILDLTLDPAIKEYGLEEVRLIDPTCGSGHFLLGAFRRLFEARQRKAPTLPAKEHAGHALAHVFGVDLNPYAAAIARFRLVLAYLEAAQIDKLKDAPRLSLNVVVADSLLFGAKERTIRFGALSEDAAAWGDDLFQLDDPREAQRIFAQSFQAVVGNPPYITCKDPVLREAYRELYLSAAGKYALSAPFTERFFQLGVDGGFVGMINANSFMKRNFGRKLIEEVLPQVELTRIMDTGGAYIPGHGTPTVLLFGRNRTPAASMVVAVLGKRGESGTPNEPAKGVVWSSIREHFADVSFDNDYISVADVPRETLNKHPWSLGGGGAAELRQLLAKRGVQDVGAIASAVGVSTVPGEDEVYLVPHKVAARLRLEKTREIATAEEIRDWSVSCANTTVFPYDASLTLLSLQHLPNVERYLWRGKPILSRRKRFGTPMIERGLTWYELQELYSDKLRTPFSIAVAEVATHNHFAFDRNGYLFKNTAQVIKLPDTSTEDDYLALVAYLNSSVVGFYVRQIAHNKGAQGVNEGTKAEAWEQFLARNGSVVSSIPVPSNWQSLAVLGRRMERLALERSAHLPQNLSLNQLGDAAEIELHSSAERQALGQMVALQEKLDWAVYRLWGFVETIPDLPETIDPGRRPFEVALVRTTPSTRWFHLNHYAKPQPQDDDPLIDWEGVGPEVALIEQPECKRRWVQINWRTEQVAAVSQQSLTLVEETVAASSRAMRFTELVQLAANTPSVCAALRLLYPEQDNPIPQMSEIVRGAAVPFVAAAYLGDSGLLKHRQWEEAWALQRRADAGEGVDVIVPPKYDHKDYRDPIYWRLRGKLDVPKEVFISYPGAERDDDPSPLYGWAGWDHLQQATALAALYHERKNDDGWSATETGREKLVPLLAGLLELVPWLKQRHNAPHEDFGGEGAGDWYERHVEAEARSIGRSLDDLRAWRPQKGTNGKARSKAKKSSSPVAVSDSTETGEG